MRGIVLLIFMSAGFGLYASEESRMDRSFKKEKFTLNRRVQHPAGFNLYALGPVGAVSASFDYFVRPKISLEIGAGLRELPLSGEDIEHGFMLGGRYHFFGNTPLNITPYVGVFSGFEYTGANLRNYNLYVPVGLQRIKRNKLTWSVEVAYQNNTYQPNNHFFGGAKLGFRF